MHPLGCRGMLTGKWTLEHLQLSRINGQPNIPAYSLTFSGPSCTLRRLVHASLSNGKHSVHHIRSGNRSSCNRSFLEFGLTLSPLCSYRAPISQHGDSWDSPKQNRGESTVVIPVIPVNPVILIIPVILVICIIPVILLFYPRHPFHLSYLFTLIILASQP